MLWNFSLHVQKLITFLLYKTNSMMSPLSLPFGFGLYFVFVSTKKAYPLFFPSPFLSRRPASLAKIMSFRFREKELRWITQKEETQPIILWPLHTCAFMHSFAHVYVHIPQTSIHKIKKNLSWTHGIVHMCVDLHRYNILPIWGFLSNFQISPLWIAWLWTMCTDTRVWSYL